MDFSRDSEFPPDLSPLAWVQEELRRSLESVHKALRRSLRDGEARTTVAAALGAELSGSPALQAAAAQLHQVAGVLSLVGLPAGSKVLAAAEQAVSLLAQNPQELDLKWVETIERADFALLSLIARILAGNKASSLSLFPSYRELLSLNGAERIHPADLWEQAWSWRPLPPDAQAQALSQSAVRGPFETTLLKAMREPSAAHARSLSDLCAALAAGLSEPNSRTLWQLASAVFEAQALDLLGSDSYVKRLGSRLLSQLRAVAQGDAGVNERLAHDLLFFCAQSRPPAAGQTAPRLLAALAAYGLGQPGAAERVNYEDETLGRIDPAWVTQARRRVSAAKDSWSSAAEGDSARAAALNEQFLALAESLQRLFPSGEVLAESLQRAVVSTLRSGAPPAPALAMEVATSLLYVDAALDDAAFDQPEQAERVRRLAGRIEAVQHGEAPEPLEAWMEDLYRRVSDRQTLGSVVQELRSNLSEVERQADEYFRDPGQRERLIPVTAQLSAMRGVFTVLGLDQAALACLRMRDEVDELANTEVDVTRGGPRELFDRLANNLGALGFLIDMLSVQPQLAKRMFVFDEASGRLNPVMGRRSDATQLPPLDPAVLAAHTAPPAMPAGLAEPPQLLQPMDMEDLPVLELPLPGAPAVAEPAAAAPRPAQDRPAAQPSLVPQMAAATDPEMQEIFLEEAAEVLATGSRALAALRMDARDQAQMTVLRRAFHTLKGSARMVGFDAFGEGAWACEQLFNARLGEAEPLADPALQAFSAEALIYLGEWCEQIAGRQPGAHQPEPLRRSADALRLAGTALPIEWPATTVETPPTAFAPTLSEPTPDSAPAPGVDAALDTPADIDSAGQALMQLAPMPAPESELPSPQLAVLPPLAPDAEPAELAHVVVPTPEPALPVLDEAVVLPDPAPELQTLGLEDLGLDLPLIPAEAPSAPLPDFELPEFELRLDLGDSAEEPAPAAPPTTPATPPSEPEDAELPALPSATIIELHRPQAPAPLEAPAAPVVEAPEPEALLSESVDEQFKMIGPLPVKLELFNIFLNEADELSRRLATQLAEWALELNRPVPASCEALAHALAGSAAAVRFDDLALLNRALEHALGRAQRAGRYSEADAQLFVLAADEVRHLLHQFAAGFLKTLNPATLAALQAYTPDPTPSSQFGALGEGFGDGFGDGFGGGLDEDSEQGPAQGFGDSLSGSLVPAAEAQAPAEDDAAVPRTLGASAAAQQLAAEFEPGLPDEIDPVLLPIFEEEARDLLRDLHAALRAWLAAPADALQGDACMRALHTFKGGARLCGAMRLGEQAHALESEIERAMAAVPSPADVLGLQAAADALEASLDQLLQGPAQAATAVASTLAETGAHTQEQAALAVEIEPVPDLPPAQSSSAQDLAEVAQPLADVQPEPQAAAWDEGSLPESALAPGAPDAAGAGPHIDWSRFAEAPLEAGTDHAPSGLQALVRVRASLLERMAAQAGEVSIRRSRLESELAQMKSALLDLDDNLDRLRAQLRELELQAEAQMGAQQEQQLKAHQGRSADFDPLEFDRYTRFQELTRMLTESVGDVATVQRSLQRNVQLGEDELAAQSRLTRELQDDLLRTRMVEFESLAERLHRVVRQAARDAGRQAKLEIHGSQTELDRSVLERMSGAFEHLLRNSVSHGIESPEQRLAAGKDAVGTLRLQVRQEGNEVLLNFSDDGAGLNLARIRERGLQLGLIQSEQAAHTSDAALMQLIFMPGFSTASQVTELSGRGVGMDVVRAEVSTLGGSIETSSVPGQGTQFALRLPLTTALTQVVLLRCGDLSVAVPASLMDSLQRVPLEQVEAAYASGSLTHAGETLPFYWLGGLLGQSGRGHSHGKHASVVLVRSAQQHMALHVDEVLGNQEVVVKNLGPQLSRVPGLAGISLLASGEVALIYNPVALATWYGVAAQAQLRELNLAALEQAQSLQAAPAVEETLAPLVLVVDDSLTVRRVTQRLLEREGYRVQLAKDGLDAMEQLAREELPDLVLSDIEMPRMDGFDLVRNMRADARLAGMPVIMITSRIAQKHRDYAEQLGVNHYLGKPYDEEQLLSLIAGYTSAPIAAEVLRP